MKKTGKILLLLFLTFPTSLLLEKFFPDWSVAFVGIHTILVAILCYEWCRSDAADNLIEPPAGSKILCAFIPPIGVPYYLFSGYGFKTGLVKLAKAILYIVFLLLIIGTLMYAVQ